MLEILKEKLPLGMWDGGRVLLRDGTLVRGQAPSRAGPDARGLEGTAHGVRGACGEAGLRSWLTPFTQNLSQMGEKT